jgi:hypothetical protein
MFCVSCDMKKRDTFPSPGYDCRLGVTREGMRAQDRDTGACAHRVLPCGEEVASLNEIRQQSCCLFSGRYGAGSVLLRRAGTPSQACGVVSSVELPRRVCLAVKQRETASGSRMLIRRSAVKCDELTVRLATGDHCQGAGTGAVLSLLIPWSARSSADLSVAYFGARHCPSSFPKSANS